MAEVKRCNRCGQEKPRTEFGPNRSRVDGLQVYCRPCQREAYRESDRRHRKKKLEARALDTYREAARAQVQRHLREPDKLLCDLQSARAALKETGE